MTYLRPMKGKVVLLALLLGGSIGLQLLNPQIIRYFLDHAQSGEMGGALTGAAALFILVALVQQGVAIGAAYAGEDVGWAATNRLRSDLTAHCLRLDMSFHNTHTPGELIERIDGDVGTLASFFSQLVIQVLGNALLALGILLLLFRESWQVGLVGLGYALALLLFMRLLNDRIVGLWSAAREASARLFGFLEERLMGLEDIRANGAEPYVMRQLYALLRERLFLQRRAALMGSLTFVAGFSLFEAAEILALVLGGRFYLQGTMTIGTVYLLFYYLGYLEGPLNEIRRQVDDLQEALASIGRVRELFAIQPVLVDQGTAALPEGALPLSFDSVRFGYGVEGAQVLHDLSFELPAGRVLGLLGHTGSGKTTLTRLLFRLYDPSSGTIRLGGLGLGELPLAELRRRVGMVTQEVQLFEATIRDNLTFFDRSLPDGEILAVIHELGLRGWLEGLPNGLDTRLTGGGRGLSAGEAQLLAFTRLFLKDPGLVILDEASSRLDPATEQLMERAVGRLLAGRTGIIIAHRLSTVQRADDILILDGGRIVEYGPRERLAADPGSHFARLLRSGLAEVLA